MGNEDLQVIYADAMRHHPFGFALYHPCDKSVIQPGSCGYFNDTGDWNPITMVLDSSSDNDDQSPFVKLEEKLQKEGPQLLRWGPKYSDHVTEHRLKGSITTYFPLGTHFTGLIDRAAAVPGIPVEANLLCKYVSSTDFGAVLLTTFPVKKEFYYHNTPFWKWFEKNSKTILQKYPEVKRYGLWIVKMTCSTPKCAVNAWRLREKHVKVGFSVDPSQVAGLEAQGNWYLARSDGGWNVFDDEVLPFV